MATYHLAEINVGTLVADTDHDDVAEFMDNLDRINKLAEEAPGFVWRLQTDEGDATAIKLWENPRALVNVSVWESIESLRDYVYTTEHAEFLRRRQEWFVPGESGVALWWVPAGTEPTPEDAKRRFELVKDIGPSPEAFTFGRRFPPPTDG